MGPHIDGRRGEAGAARMLKLTNNILSAVAFAATAEAFVMAAKGGLDPEVMLPQRPERAEQRHGANFRPRR